MPPIAPWLRPFDTEALNRGVRMGLALRNQRQQEKENAEALRLREEQLRALTDWRKEQAAVQAERQGLAVRALESAERRAMEANASRERVAEALAKQRAELAAEGNRIKTRAAESLDAYRQAQIQKLNTPPVGLNPGDVHVGQSIARFNKDTGKYEEVFTPSVKGMPITDKMELLDLYSTRRQIRKSMEGITDQTQLTPLMQQLDANGKAINRLKNKFTQPAPAAPSALSNPVLPKDFSVKYDLPSSGQTSMEPPQYEPGPNPTGPLGTAPANPSERLPGATYVTPKGQHRWTGKGWVPTTPAPAVAPAMASPSVPEVPMTRPLTNRDGVLPGGFALDTTGYDAIRQLDAGNEDDIDALLQELLNEDANDTGD